MKKRLGIIFVFIIFINIFAYLHFKPEKDLYYWDLVRGWGMVRELSRVMYQQPWNVIPLIVRSINTADYNFLPTVFLLPFIGIFGDSRLSYILALVNSYLVPCFILYLSLIFRNNKYLQVSNLLLVFITFLFFLPTLISPIFSGYEDIICVFETLIILYFLQITQMKRESVRSHMIIGVLLAILFISRRYFIFWSISCIVSYFMFILVNIVFYKFDRKKTFIALKNLIILIIFFAVTLLLIAKGLIVRITTYNYSFSYASARTNNWLIPEVWQNLKLILNYYGVFLIFFCFIGMVVGIRTVKYRFLTTLITIQLLLIIISFSMIQDFNDHHYYIFSSIFLLLITVAIIKSYQSVRKIYKYIYIVFFIIVLLIVLPIKFLTIFQYHSQIYDVLFGHAQHYSLENPDLNTLRTLSSSIIQKIRGNQDRAYILASSVLINSDRIIQACFEIEGSSSSTCNRILRTRDIDNRDGFPSELYYANIIALAVPFQLSTIPEGQKVVIIPAKQLLSGTGFGAFFQKLSETYQLSTGVTVYLYQRKEIIDFSYFHHSLDDLEDKLHQ